MTVSSFLPYGRHLIEDDDIDAVVAVLRSEALTTGPAVPRFEAALVQATGANHAVACGNGTQALHLAALALGLGPGDRAIVPAITFLATANAVRMTGAEVVFADVDANSGLITAETALAAERGSEGPIKAVLPVHLAGQFGDMAALAQSRNWAVIEDACHAIGTRYDFGDGVQGRVGDGRWSDATCFSFHPVKTIAMGEGGAVTTNDPALAQRMTDLRCHGMTREAARFVEPTQAFAADGTPHPWYYEAAELGFNYRASDILCALGLSQLKKLERFATRRRHLAALYDRLLAPLAPVVLPPVRMPSLEVAWHLYAVRIDFQQAGISRDRVMTRLRAEGIGTQVHYIPVPWQPTYRTRQSALSLPGATRYYERTLSLPLFPAMADADTERVILALENALSSG